MTVIGAPSSRDTADSGITSKDDDRELAERKLYALRRLLEADLLAADLAWSLFVSACNTYRHDSCLRPFPPMYRHHLAGPANLLDPKDIDALKADVDAVPPLDLLLRELSDNQTTGSSAYLERRRAAIDLLYWLLVKSNDFDLATVKRDQHSEILAMTNSQSTRASSPNVLFEIRSRKPLLAQNDKRRTVFAYHGSKLENFYSILNHGLQQHLCQKNLFGSGIYLSSELAVSLAYSPTGYGWGASILGSNLGCVALCEILDHPDVKSTDTDDQARHIGPDSIGGKLPKKYYLVLNNELVRVRYLLVYTDDFGRIKSTPNNGLVGWIKHHKLFTLVIGYAILLIAVGLSQNRHFKTHIKTFANNLGLDY